MQNGLIYKIHNKIPSNFQRSWGEMEKWSEKNFTQQFRKTTDKVEKRVLPGSGEADWGGL